MNLRSVSILTADYPKIGDTRISVSKSHYKEPMKHFPSFPGETAVFCRRKHPTRFYEPGRALFR